LLTMRRALEVQVQAVVEGEPEPPATDAPVTASQLFDVGCTAELRQVTELPDGRFDIVTVGRRRFRMLSLDAGATPYMTAEVEWLPDEEPAGETADRLAPRVLAAFRTYLDLLRPDSEMLDQIPDDPTVLSHLVAATAQLTLEERQSLLAAPDTAARLRAELKLLNREAGLLARVRAVPVPLSDLARPASPN
jgi:Lon protease-like protein